MEPVQQAEGATYRHEPITQDRNIRLMKLYPASKGHNLQCKLFEVNLDDPSCPRYRALSYVWGPKDSACHIACNGRLISITPSCEAALQRLRNPVKAQYWWVDAICIDQTSEEERGSQVNLMVEIYDQAYETAAWLGPGSNSTKTCMRLIGLLGFIKRCRISQSPQLFFLPRILDVLGYSKDYYTHGLHDLVSNEYFRRVWTLQELCLSPRSSIYCRSAKVSWRAFGSGAVSLVEMQTLHHFRNGSDYEGALFYRMLWGWLRHLEDAEISGSLRQLPLEALLLLPFTVYLKATDPKDKVFALYGIFQRLLISVPKPDYTMSVGQLYTEAAFSSITIYESLQILESVDSDVRLPDLPSWVPDWSSYEPCLRTSIHTQATRQSRVFPRRSEDGKRLLLRGKAVGVVSIRGVPMLKHSADGGVFPFTPASLYCITVLLEWIRFAVPKDQYDRSASFDQPLTKILYMLSFHDASDDMTITKRLIWFNCLTSQFWGGTERLDKLKRKHAYDQNVINHLVDPINTTSISKDPAYEIAKHLHAFKVLRERNYHWATTEKLIGSVIFKTLDNLIGVAFHTIRPGDVVALLQGATMPYILRPEGNCYRFVAAAIISGMMSGEEWPNDEEKLVDFTLI